MIYGGDVQLCTSVTLAGTAEVSWRESGNTTEWMKPETVSIHSVAFSLQMAHLQAPLVGWPLID